MARERESTEMHSPVIAVLSGKQDEMMQLLRINLWDRTRPTANLIKKPLAQIDNLETNTPISPTKYRGS